MISVLSLASSNISPTDRLGGTADQKACRRFFSAGAVRITLILAMIAMFGIFDISWKEETSWQVFAGQEEIKTTGQFWNTDKVTMLALLDQEPDALAEALNAISPAK